MESVASESAVNGSSPILAISAGGMAARHPARPSLPILAGPATEAQFNTRRAPLVAVACWCLHDVRFSFASSFVAPKAARDFQSLDSLRQAHPTAPLSLFGHADPTGTDDYNKQLSGRRAASVYAVLTRDVSRWETLYSQPLGDDQWGLKSVQIMLAALGTHPGAADGVMGPATGAAVRAFQQANGLAVDGDPGPQTRARLFAVYMDFLCRDAGGAPYSLSPADFLARGADPGGKGDYQGCSSFNPLIIFSGDEERQFQQDSDKNARNDANAPNRRVVGFLFRPGTVVAPGRWPCPSADEGTSGCVARFYSDADGRRAHGPESRQAQETRDTFACRFYDRIARGSPCERVLPLIQIRLFNRDSQPVLNAPYRLTVGAAKFEDVAVDGHAEALGWDVPDRCHIEWNDPNEETTPQEPGSFTYARDIFLGLEDLDPLDAAQRRLHNLGYTAEADLAKNVENCQHDFDLAVSGQLADMMDKLREAHDALQPKPRVSIDPRPDRSSAKGDA